MRGGSAPAGGPPARRTGTGAPVFSVALPGGGGAGAACSGSGRGRGLPAAPCAAAPRASLPTLSPTARRASPFRAAKPLDVRSDQDLNEGDRFWDIPLRRRDAEFGRGSVSASSACSALEPGKRGNGMCSRWVVPETRAKRGGSRGRGVPDLVSLCVSASRR